MPLREVNTELISEREVIKPLEGAAGLVSKKTMNYLKYQIKNEDQGLSQHFVEEKAQKGQNINLHDSELSIT